MLDLRLSVVRYLFLEPMWTEGAVSKTVLHLKVSSIYACMYLILLTCIFKRPPIPAVGQGRSK
jgi:hypothetical protein